MCGAEERLVDEAFKSNWIAPLGPHVDQFERELASLTDRTDAVVLSSGTAAIHLALLLVGVGHGDVVICQSFTFAGTVNPVTYLGATPLLVDSERTTWNLDPEAVREAIVTSVQRGKRPKAIIAVHLYGMPAQMSALSALSQEYGIPLIEDAAEALGSTLDGRPCGGFGDFSILSFNGNKIITTSGGGALLANNPALIAEARFLASQARDDAPHYQHSRIGYNYRLSNVLAAIGRGQLTVLSERVAARRANFERYAGFFANIDGIQLLSEPSGAYSNRWLTTIVVDPALTGGLSRTAIYDALAADNIEARPLWKPMHLQPVFAQAPYFGGAVAETLFRDGLCLPSGSNLTSDDFDRIFSVLGALLATR
jgi:dTDP-4-amino-4,6-dideoxygalactose transaminase